MIMPEKPTYEELERRVQELDETETEHRQRIESLRRRENHFRSMVENIPIGLYRTASNGRIIEANPALVKMLGFPDRESLLSVTSAQFYVREEDQREQRRILDRDLELHGFETELRRADGSVLWVRDSARAIRGPDGEVVYAGSLEDITDKKQAEEALEAQRAHLKSLFDHSGEAIVLLDTGNRIIDANSGFVNLFGFSLEEARGKVIEDLICPERFYHTESKELDERSLMGIRGMEIIRRRKDGEEIHVRTSAGPIKVGGSIIGRFLVFDDITPQKQAERALRESEETLRGIFDTMHSGIILVDRDGGIRFANKRMAEMLGYRLDEIIGSGYLDHTHGSESSEATENMHVLIRGEIDSITVERRYQRGDGSIFWGHLSGRRLLHPDGTFRALVGVITDITERRRAEERLRLHSLVLDQIEDRVTVTDLDGYITYINDAACRMLGKDGTRLVGQHVSAFGEDAGKGATQQEIIRRTLQEGAWRGEVTNIRSDGSAVMLDCRSQVVKDDEGRAIALCGISTDVTERKKAEEALRESEHRFRELFNNINDLIYTQDLGGRFLSVNRAMCSSLGYGEDELIGKRASEFMKPELAGLFEQEYLDRLKTSGYHNGTAVYFTKSGEKIYLEYRSSLVRPEKGEPYISGMGRDVTDKILSEKKIDSLRKQYYHAQRMEAIGTLAGGIAHDFNNILGIILGNTELAMLGLPEWNPARENLEEVCRATLRARDLVTQILLFARQKEHVLSTVRVEPIVKESLKMLRASIPTTVEMRQEIREGLPPILADPSQIQQIVMNLCTNAGQVMEAEGGTLEVTLDSIDLSSPMDTLTGKIPVGPYVRLRVHDTGPGITSENLDRVFEPFFTTKGVGEGTGLGLAVVHGIVRERSGGITLESEPGHGTTFTVYLPVTTGEAMERETEKRSAPPRGSERILFVDDEPMIIRLGKRMLENLGDKLETLERSTEALETFRRDPSRFDLVITDMTMPGMRGDKLAEEIMAIRPDIPMILCTGYSRQITEERAREIGIRAFVMKPLTANELGNVVRRVLDGK